MHCQENMTSFAELTNQAYILLGTVEILLIKVQKTQVYALKLQHKLTVANEYIITSTIFVWVVFSKYMKFETVILYEHPEPE